MPSRGEGINEFLRARYEERRALALAATAGPWEAEVEFHKPRKPLVQIITGPVSGSRPGYFAVRPVAELEGNGDGGVSTAADAEFIAAHGPDVVLADLDAKLAVVNEHPGTASYVYTDDGTPACGTCGDSTIKHPCRTLRLLAVPFAAHPDYDERWRP